MRAHLAGLATARQWAHLGGMERATKRPEGFRKPAHWTDAPVPKPAPPRSVEELSPTRYGDWVRDGIAVDF